MPTIHQRHGQTDGQTDRQMDGRLTIAIPRQHYVHRAVKTDGALHSQRWSTPYDDGNKTVISLGLCLKVEVQRSDGNDCSQSFDLYTRHDKSPFTDTHSEDRPCNGRQYVRGVRRLVQFLVHSRHSQSKNRQLF